MHHIHWVSLVSSVLSISSLSENHANLFVVYFLIDMKLCTVVLSFAKKIMMKYKNHIKIYTKKQITIEYFN